ncbi:unnamed protein product [Coffea canephora]|uniref:Uncharacterized protein n=1 Tax=Coffea canephora TaxID=49390 RepID=A0A068UF46_COFCA|nr:unnamed protein product [Coffea canephora]
MTDQLRKLRFLWWVKQYCKDYETVSFDDSSTGSFLLNSDSRKPPETPQFDIGIILCSPRTTSSAVFAFPISMSISIYSCGSHDRQLRPENEGSAISGRQGKDAKIEHRSRWLFHLNKIFERKGVKLVVDKISLDFVKGATVDYVEELIRSAFQVSTNPIAVGGCSCKSSFVV